MPLLDDRLTITAPEGVQLSGILADPISRMWALLIDLSIMFLIVLAQIVLFIFLPNRTMLGISFAFGFILLWGYFFLFEWRWHGITPGKHWLNIQVVSQDLTPMSASQCAWRNVLRYLDLMPGCFGLGMLSIFISPKSQRLGDWMAGTVVIYRKPTKLRKTVLSSGEALIPTRHFDREAQRTLIDFACYAQYHNLERAIELSDPFKPLLPNMNGEKRVQMLMAWARWLSGQRPTDSEPSNLSLHG